jgi:hypothetical protein
LEFSDAQIADADRKQREALRALARAEADLGEYEKTAARDLTQRFADLRKREWEDENGEKLAALRTKLTEYLTAGRRMAELERERNELYRTLGFGQPLNLFQSTGDRANDWDVVRREIAQAFPDLLDETDPQRLLVQRMRANDEYYRNPPKPEPIEPQAVLRRVLPSPAARVTNFLRGVVS